MKLIDRQIKAVRETLEQVLEEYRKGKEYHHWDCEKCFVCSKFRLCCNCPLTTYCDKDFAQGEGYDSQRDAPLEDIAGFLQSLLISLEEITRD